MPKNFTHKKRHTAPDGPGPGRPRKAPVERAVKATKHEVIAGKLWAPSYDMLFQLEAAEDHELLTLLREAVNIDQSTDRRRPGHVRERQEVLVAAAVEGVAAQVRRLRNRGDIPLVIAARSLSWLMGMARSKQWKEELKQRRLLHRTTTVKLLHAMTAAAPPLPFAVNELVSLAFVDQTYMQNAHYGSRRHVRVERLDAAGVRVQSHFDVYVNSVSLPVPSAAAALGVDDLRQIVERGPYTEDPSAKLLPALQPAVVRLHQRDFVLRSSMRLLDYSRAAQTVPRRMHAHAAYEAAALGATHAEDPVRPSTHHEVAKLVEAFVGLLGTDLTAVDPSNPFGSVATPWEAVWRVASGRAFGKDRATLESVSAWAERHVADGAF